MTCLVSYLLHTQLCTPNSPGHEAHAAASCTQTNTAQQLCSAHVEWGELRMSEMGRAQLVRTKLSSLLYADQSTFTGYSA